MSKWEVVCVYTAGTVAQVCGAGQEAFKGCWMLDAGWGAGARGVGVWMDKVGRGAGVAAVLRDRSEESFGGKRAKATHGSTDGRTTRVALFQSRR